ncbi:hypothetical protein [Demequina subtropica]|uniref:hypothetical protein n=1 Tax=Demequina subtropica TaxID=1638989 RepID=UPI0007834A4B|nr:hypothetical protein [Demequina subtropica]
MTGAGFWLGVGAIVAAIIALVLFWAPLAGIIVAVVAAGLAVASLVIGVRRGSGSGMAVGIVTTLASFVAIGCAVGYVSIFGIGQPQQVENPASHTAVTAG